MLARDTLDGLRVRDGPTAYAQYLYLSGEYTASAEALMERDPDWAAPVLWRSEFRNILAGRG